MRCLLKSHTICVYRRLQNIFWTLTDAVGLSLNLNHFGLHQAELRHSKPVKTSPSISWVSLAVVSGKNNFIVIATNPDQWSLAPNVPRVNSFFNQSQEHQL